IERLAAPVIGDRSRESKVFRGAAGAGVAPEVDPDQPGRGEEPGSLLANLADDRLDQRLATLDVSRRLVDDEAAVDALLDDEKATVGLSDGGNRDLGVGHGRNYIPSRR